jgi:hypothetical protein
MITILLVCSPLHASHWRGASVKEDRWLIVKVRGCQEESLIDRPITTLNRGASHLGLGDFSVDLVRIKDLSLPRYLGSI